MPASPKVPERARRWAERQDPGALEAMRALFACQGCTRPGAGRSYLRCPHLSPEHRAALEGWLGPRVEALVDLLVATRHAGAA